MDGIEGPEGEQRHSSALTLSWAPDGDGWSTVRHGCFTPGKRPSTDLQEVRRTLEQVWTGAENLASTGIRSPDR